MQEDRLGRDPCTETYRERQTGRQRGKETHIHTDRQQYVNTKPIHTSILPDRHTDAHTDRETDSHTVSHTYIHTNIQAGMQTAYIQS